MTAMRTLYRDQAGATMVEYALMIALIAIVCFASVSLFGSRVAAAHRSNADAVGTVAEQACTDAGNTWDAGSATCIP